jgi:hypothetical protein
MGGILPKFNAKWVGKFTDAERRVRICFINGYRLQFEFLAGVPILVRHD